MLDELPSVLSRLDFLSQSVSVSAPMNHHSRHSQCLPSYGLSLTHSMPSYFYHHFLLFRFLSLFLIPILLIRPLRILW
ncbi:MAG: hypothetical protein BYD32DRAFT_235003 [Podila humilis]|nr:MAG: hypothetical protein BYD32DRAFT_235003 [Podila humilis]